MFALSTFFITRQKVINGIVAFVNGLFAIVKFIYRIFRFIFHWKTLITTALIVGYLFMFDLFIDYCEEEARQGAVAELQASAVDHGVGKWEIVDSKGTSEFQWVTNKYCLTIDIDEEVFADLEKRGKK